MKKPRGKGGDKFWSLLFCSKVKQLALYLNDLPCKKFLSLHKISH